MKGTAALVVFLALAGCSKPERHFMGVWDGRAEISPEAARVLANEFAPGDPDAEQGVRVAVAATTLVLELMQDKSYTLTMTLPGEPPDTVTGTWLLSDDRKHIVLQGSMMSPEKLAELRKAGRSENEIVNMQGSVTNLAVGEGRKALAGDLGNLGSGISCSFTKRD
jgi:hypothetical protein